MTHEKYLRRWGWPVIILLLPISFIVSKNILYPIFILLNFLICEYLSPDYDQISISHDEGDVLRATKRLKMGLFGSLWVAYWFPYAFIIGLFGGHRSVASHGFIIGTIGRMIYFNILWFGMMFGTILYGIGNWGWEPISIVGIRYFYMDVWLLPYLIGQFIAWNVGDSVHLILDGILLKHIMRPIVKRINNAKRK